MPAALSIRDSGLFLCGPFNPDSFRRQASVFSAHRGGNGISGCIVQGYIARKSLEFLVGEVNLYYLFGWIITDLALKGRA